MNVIGGYACAELVRILVKHIPLYAQTGVDAHYGHGSNQKNLLRRSHVSRHINKFWSNTSAAPGEAAALGRWVCSDSPRSSTGLAEPYRAALVPCKTPDGSGRTAANCAPQPRRSRAACHPCTGHLWWSAATRWSRKNKCPLWERPPRLSAAPGTCAYTCRRRVWGAGWWRSPRIRSPVWQSSRNRRFCTCRRSTPARWRVLCPGARRRGSEGTVSRAQCLWSSRATCPPPEALPVRRWSAADFGCPQTPWGSSRCCLHLQILRARRWWPRWRAQCSCGAGARRSARPRSSAGTPACSWCISWLSSARLFPRSTPLCRRSRTPRNPQVGWNAAPSSGSPRTTAGWRLCRGTFVQGPGEWSHGDVWPADCYKSRCPPMGRCLWAAGESQGLEKASRVPENQHAVSSPSSC